MSLTIPMIWREPKDYLTDCYFCKVNDDDWYQMMILTAPIALPKKSMYQIKMILTLIGFSKLNRMALSETNPSQRIKRTCWHQD